MKKYLALLLALAMLALTACGTAQANTENKNTDAPAENAGQTLPVNTVEAKRIEPLAETLDVSNLQDATVAVGFGSDAVHEQDGQMQVDLTIYSYDVYDMVDMSQLTVGDTIVVDGKDMLVSSREEENGVIAINGGYENDGAYFASGDDGVYYVIGPDDMKDYREIGKLTVPVSDDFVLTDNSDLSNPDKTYTAADLAQLAEEGAGFQPANTLATLENGQLTTLTRSYTP